MTIYAEIPPSCQQIFEKLEDDVIWLHSRWAMFKRLYSKSRARLDLLNATAVEFFADVQWLWWEYLIVNVCRLADKPTQGANQNLVLGQLPANLSPTTHGPLVSKLEALVKTADDSIAPLREWRNKHVAHRDLPTQLATLSPLPGLSDKSIETAIADITNVLDEFRMAFVGTRYPNAEMNELAGVETLVDCLKRSQEYRQLEKEDSAYRDRLRRNQSKDA